MLQLPPPTDKSLKKHFDFTLYQVVMHHSLGLGLASRKGRRGDQVVLLKPPWQGEPLRLSVGNSYSVSSGLLRRPVEADAPDGGTGVYRIYADEPYNPRKSGIRGFSRDLGVLIHKVKMELVGNDAEDGFPRTAPAAE